MYNCSVAIFSAAHVWRTFGGYVLQKARLDESDALTQNVLNLDERQI